MTDLAANPSSPEFATTDSFSADAEIRKAIVDGAIAMFSKHPFHEVTFAHVAQEAGVSTEMITRQFGTFDGLVLATVDRWNAKRMKPLRPIAERYGTVVFLRGIVEANLADPALMRLIMALLNVAALPDHPMGQMLRDDWKQFHQLVQHHLARDVELGREPATMDPARGAEQLVALYEGLTIQWMVRPRMDLLDSYDRAVTRLRTGWSRAYTAPVWDIAV